jgi:hypothetical protein
MNCDRKLKQDSSPITSEKSVEEMTGEKAGWCLRKSL